MTEGSRADVRCSGQNWPAVPPLDRLFPPEERNSLQLQKLVLDHDALAALGQDVFKGHEVEELQLPFNDIANVNVNAFRGVEVSKFRGREMNERQYLSHDQ